MRKFHRRLRKLPGLLLFLAIFWYWSAFTLTAARVELTSEKLKKPVTIVQLSDLHSASFGRGNRLLLDAVRRESPDLVVLTGDLYTYGDEAGQARALALAEALAEERPVYYVNGEHDNSAAFHEALSRAGVQILDYETAELPEYNLCLYGISNVYFSPTYDLHNAFTLDPSKYNLLLAHQVNANAYASFGLDLALCGDTHGGLIRLPRIGAVYYEGRWFPEQGPEPEYLKGLYSLGGFELFISSGLGNYPLPLRLFNRPEIAVVRLSPE